MIFKDISRYTPIFRIHCCGSIKHTNTKLWHKMPSFVKCISTGTQKSTQVNFRTPLQLLNFNITYHKLQTHLNTPVLFPHMPRHVTCYDHHHHQCKMPFRNDRIFAQVLLRVKVQRNIIHEISKRKANWIGHILSRNCLLRQVIEGKINGGIDVARWGRWCRKLMDDLKEGNGYPHLKEVTRSHYVESLIWKKLQTCRETDY
jgi:hypothetical protein